MSLPSKVVVYDQQGPPDSVTRIVELPSAEIKEDVVCVRMLASPINLSNINRIEGVYPVRSPMPAIGGYEGVGEVYLCRATVRGLSPADQENQWHKISKCAPIEYASTLKSGTFCSCFSAVLACLGLLDTYLTIFNLLFLIPIVQNGATSIVGQAGSEDVREQLKKLGADEVFTDNQLEIKNVKSLLLRHLISYLLFGSFYTYRINPMELTSIGTHLLYWVVTNVPGQFAEPALGFNRIGGNAATFVMKFLRQEGTMVTYGGMSKKPVTVSTSSFIFKDLSLRGFWLQKWMTSDKAKECRTMIDYLLELASKGKIKYEMEPTPFEDLMPLWIKHLENLGANPNKSSNFDP
ncbi:Alcohol dehydrogenase-like, C-terminal [Dillenia turbinata]|uniref:Alcohol dehydrogenase-like, C-terminal n=1 Tax=Dillenia turbinata TaxID=194707 RepID=A0AAN8V3I3_9MAGN